MQNYNTITSDMVDMKQMMILIKGLDKTEEIQEMVYDKSAQIVKIKYKKKNEADEQKAYNTDCNVVEIREHPKHIQLNGKIPCAGLLPLEGFNCILQFGDKIRICYSKEHFSTIDIQNFSLVKEVKSERQVEQTWKYLREISQYVRNRDDNQTGKTFLQKRLEEITVISSESVLGTYLSGGEIVKRDLNKRNIIFPFGFNLSQKAALENGLSSSVSIIEGPPGTGKTQTILNILANLVAVQRKSVAVVSNNNDAVKNIIDKLEKEGYGFLTAFLGKSENQKNFFENLSEPLVEDWDYGNNIDYLFAKVADINDKLNGLLEKDRARVQLKQELDAWQLEQQHFEEYYSNQNVEEIKKLPLFCRTSEKIVSFLAETTIAKEYDKSQKFLFKLKLLFKYGVFDYKKLNQNETALLLNLQKEFYKQQIAELQEKILLLDRELQNASFEELKMEHKKYSEIAFQSKLFEKYHNMKTGKFFQNTYKNKYGEFLNRFPIILSTTHSLRFSIPDNYLLDYVIIDEASQVDLITGVLALSCCRNLIIVGDEKQLPQITNNEIRKLIKLNPTITCYDYFQHSILSSVHSLYGNKVPCTMLREHYRCHPKIIEFCNQQYYNGQLISYTDSELSECPLVLYKTVEGNHMRVITQGKAKGIYNQRELEVIVQEVLSDKEMSDTDDIGFITPYRKQANKADMIFGSDIQCDTVHKYQGREKDIIIMSTVLSDNYYGKRSINFVDDPKMINVAVSRAIKQFVLVTDHDLFFNKGKEVKALIKYMMYSTLDENIIQSQVVSVFDLLYKKYSEKLLPLKEKMDSTERWKSEDAMRVLLDQILEKPEYNLYYYRRQILIQNLLGDDFVLEKDERKYVENRASLDFVIYNKMDKQCVLVIEVDGVAFHENSPVQQRRDKLKNSILEKMGIPLLRLATNGDSEEKKIEEALDQINNA